VGTRQPAFRFLNPFAEDTRQCAFDWIVEANSRVLVVCDDHSVVTVDGNVFWRVQLSLQRWAIESARLSRPGNGVDLSVGLDNAQSVPASFQDVNVVSGIDRNRARICEWTLSRYASILRASFSTVPSDSTDDSGLEIHHANPQVF